MSTKTLLRTEDAITAVAKLALDNMTAKHTGFPGFRDLVEAKGGYYPTFYVFDKKRPELMILADAYDQAQELRGDARRSYRVTA